MEFLKIFDGIVNGNKYNRNKEYYFSFNDSDIYKHAIREFKLSGYDPIDKCENGPNKWIQQNILELLEVFAKQGHSGFSANYCIEYFKKLAKFETLSPLTFSDDEFNDVGDDYLQNNRLSSVFKYKKYNRPYYLNAIVWKNQNGCCYSGGCEEISSSQYIKMDKPFIPKTFYIDIIDWEVNKETGEPEEGTGWWESKIKDRSQLDEAFKYYDFKEMKNK